MNRRERRTTAHASRRILPIVFGALLMVCGAEAGANGLAGSEIGTIGTLRAQHPADLAKLSCDELQRDRSLRNSMLPSKRRALIDACRARESEIVVAGGPPAPLPPALTD